MTTAKNRTSLWISAALAALALIASGVPALAGQKPGETNPVRTQAFDCPQGATRLCIPLDASFSVVDFSEQACSGPSSAADPCQRNDDDFSFQIPLPFSFNLYGNVYNSVFINNNGNLSFDAGYCTFTSTGFPVGGFPMVAPFWADVDTRDAASGVVYYRLEPTRLTVIWDHVGYFSGHSDKNNTFEVIISNGTDPLLGIGNNVCFCYDDMQWTTGDASNGVNGFGGTPATVGVNKGDGATFALIGRFDHEGIDYDGPGGNPDGVSYLDNQHFCFDTSGTSGDNLPPVGQGFPPAGTVIEVCVGVCDTLETSFVSPELGQTTTTVVDLQGLANATVTSTPGNPSTQRLIFCPTADQIGLHTVRYTATDDGNPPAQTVIDVTIAVRDCLVPVEKQSWGNVKNLFR
jgi:Nidogen-like